MSDGMDELLKAAREGDAHAIQDLHHALAPWLLRAARRLARDRHVEDVAQEAWLDVGRNLATVPNIDTLRARLYWMVRARAMNFGVQSDKRADRNRIAGLARATAAEPTPSRELRHDERALHVESSLQELPEAERLAVLLREVDNLTWAEMEEFTGIPESTLKDHCRRGLGRLKARHPSLQDHQGSR